MATVSTSDLKAGMRLAYDVRDASGRLLVRAKRPLDEGVLGSLRARKITHLVVRAAEELPEGVEASADGAAVGGAWLMAQGVVDASSVMVEGAGEDGVSVEIGAVLQGGHRLPGEAPGEPVARAGTLAREPVAREPDARMVEHRRELARVRAALRRAAEGVIAWRSARWARLTLRVGAVHEPLELGDEGMILSGPDARAQERFDRTALVHRVLSRLSAGLAVGAGAPMALVEEMIDETTRRPGLCVSDALGDAAGSDEPAVRAIAAAQVSVAIGLRLGWADGDVLSAGLAGMLADAGMGVLPFDVRLVARELTEIEAAAVRRHAEYSAALMELIRDGGPGEVMPEAVQLAVSQHHERESGVAGGGYPRGVRCEEIHDLAKVVGVADVFVGMISPRAHRPGIAVRDALGEMVRMAGAGELSKPVVRALVEVVGHALGRGVGGRVEVRVGGGRVAA